MADGRIAATDLAEISGCQSGGVLSGESFGPELADVAPLAVASLAEEDPAAFAAGLGGRGSASQGLDAAGGREAQEVVAELGTQGGSEESAGAGQGAEGGKGRVLLEE